MRKIIIYVILFVSFFVNSQNKQVLYDFAGLPQTLLLNPGLETNYKYHIGVPLLSGFSAEFGNTGFTVSDIFLNDNISINTKIATVLSNLDTRDFVKLNSQIEIFSGGFRYDEKTYFSFGFYEELDGIAYYPKDIITFVNEGNLNYLNRSFDLSQIRYKFDVFGVIHAGVTRKVSNKLTIGGRLKIYSSALNVESLNNSGTVTTNLGNKNIYIQYLDNINVNFRSSGLVANNEFITDPSTYLKNTFLGGNLGLGLDFGLTYHINDQLQFSGSIIDFGFIHHKKNVKNTVTEGSFTFEGIDFEFTETERNFWEELNTEFREQLPTTENASSYISWRPMKLNAALKYSFGEKRSKHCYDYTYKDFYTDAIGAQLYTVFRPLTPQLALTGFYEKSFLKNFNTKVTYTIDDYSSSNIGLGVSTKFWKVNFYGILDNILELQDISSANNVSLQFGFNLIFN